MSGRPTNEEMAIADLDTNLEQGWVVRRYVQALVDAKCRPSAFTRILDVDKLTRCVSNARDIDDMNGDQASHRVGGRVNFGARGNDRLQPWRLDTAR